MTTGVGPAAGGSEGHGVAGGDQVLDLHPEVGERRVVAADRLDPGRRSGSKAVRIRLRVEVLGDLVVPLVPHLLDEGPDPQFSLRSLHGAQARPASRQLHPAITEDSDGTLKAIVTGTVALVLLLPLA